MMNEELYINGKLVDLSAPASIALTFQANNIGELQNRQNDFSNEFQLPKTPTNRQVFEFADNMNSATLIPYRKLDARYVVDGVDQVSSGVGKLVRTTETHYIVQVLGGNASYLSEVGDLKVSQLLGTSLDHINNFANVTGSRSNSTGYIYPFIDWMEQGIETEFINSNVNARRLLPCVFIKTIFQKADELSGFESYGALKDLPDFNNLILTPNALERGQAAKDQYNKSAKITTDQTFLIGTDNSAPTVVNYTPIMANYSGNFVGSTFTADAGLYGYFVFSGNATLVYRRYEDVGAGAREVKVFAQIVKTSTGAVIEQEQVFGLLVTPDPTAPDADISVDLSFSVVTSNITFTAGEQYFVRFRVEDTKKSSFTAKINDEFRFQLDATIPYNGFMPVGELFEGITFKQVCQDVLNMYASLPITNTIQKKIRFGLFDELLDNIGVADDWSSKLHGNTFEAEYTFGKYAQVNAMKYKEIEGVTQYYGDSSFSIDDTNLPESGTAIQMNTSATEDELRYSGVNYPRIKSLDASRIFTKTNFRILLLDRKNTSYPHIYTDGSSTLSVNTNAPYCTFRPLHFDVLKANYYEALLQLLIKTKTPAYIFKLTPQDVQELDYLTPIYLDVHNEDIDVTGYFYLNQIANYVNGFGVGSLVRL